MAIRKSDFAGSWYPGKESDCRQVIAEFSKACPPCPTTDKTPVGGIVPHAGWYYSGKIACHVIKCLEEKSNPDTIVIFGRHLHPRSGNYIMKEGAWDTPLGEIEIDHELAAGLASEFSFTIETDSHYEQDNTIELQLPFIKHFFPSARIVPLGVPPAVSSLKIGQRAAELSEALNRKIIVLGSTDLTHYGYNYGYVPKGTGEEAVQWVKDENDRKVIDLILKMDAKGVIDTSLKDSNACCSGAVASAITGAAWLGATKGEELYYFTSFDVRPDNSFVGYVGIVFH
jgi:AmmeMemoRadiSam system protein B